MTASPPTIRLEFGSAFDMLDFVQVVSDYVGRLTGLDLLHTPAIERRLIQACVSAGASDGVTRRREPTVDSLGADIHAAVVDLLRLASRSGIMGGGRAGRRKRS